jgi:hypothetical protein
LVRASFVLRKRSFDHLYRLGGDVRETRGREVILKMLEIELWISLPNLLLPETFQCQ